MSLCSWLSASITWWAMLLWGWRAAPTAMVCGALQQGLADGSQLPVVQGRGHHQHLALRRAVVVDFQHIFAKTHVQHAIGLIQHQHLQRVQAGAVAFAVLQQAPGCGDDNLRIFAEQGLLVPEVGAAGDAIDLQRRFGQQRAALFQHLASQFPGGYQDQCPGGRPGAGVVRRQEALHHGHQVGQRLAAAGFRAHHQVVAGQRRGNDLVLDLGGFCRNASASSASCSRLSSSSCSSTELVPFREGWLIMYCAIKTDKVH